jgi:hypothetical protein
MVLLTFALVLEHLAQRHELSPRAWGCGSPDGSQFISQGINIAGVIEQALPGALGTDLWRLTLAITVNLTCRDV